MNLLKNKKDLDTWQRDNLTNYDEPEEFPCYVYLVVSSWQYEIDHPIYLYRKDIEEMLYNLNA